MSAVIPARVTVGVWRTMLRMSGRRRWALTPRQSVESACARDGRDTVVAGCVRLLTGDDSDVTLIISLGGPHAERVLDGGPTEDQRYWLRVWAARGLLWAWDDNATEAVRSALRDPAWRVREMCAKVIARHAVGDLLEAVADLREDPVPRVRTAAIRAVDTLARDAA